MKPDWFPKGWDADSTGSRIAVCVPSWSAWKRLRLALGTWVIRQTPSRNRYGSLIKRNNLS